MFLKRSSHSPELAPQGADVRAHKGLDPYLLAVLIRAFDTRESHQERMHIAIDGLVRPGRDTKHFMKEADMFVTAIGKPIPRLAVDVVVGKFIQAFHVAEIVHHH